MAYRPVTRHVQELVRGTKWSERRDVENIIRLEQYARFGAESMPHAMLLHRLVRVYYRHYAAILDELDPGWREREEARERERTATREREQQEQALQARREREEQKRIWSELGGIVDA